MKTSKRIISLILTVLMLVSTIAAGMVSASAAQVKKDVRDGLGYYIEEANKTFQRYYDDPVIGGTFAIPEESLAVLRVVVSEANSVYVDSSATDEELYEQLENLYSALYYVEDVDVKDFYLGGLKAASSYAGSLDSYNYTESSYKVLKDALPQFFDPYFGTSDLYYMASSQKEVDEATDALNQAIANLVPVGDATVPVETIEVKLERLIARSNYYLNTSKEKYTVESKANLQQAYDAAVAVRNSQNATDEEITIAAYELEMAMNNFTLINLEALDSAIIKADLVNYKGIYTDGSYSDLQDALINAKQTLSSYTTQEEVDEAAGELYWALFNLKETTRTIYVSVTAAALDKYITAYADGRENPMIVTCNQTHNYYEDIAVWTEEIRDNGTVIYGMNVPIEDNGDTFGLIIEDQPVGTVNTRDVEFMVPAEYDLIEFDAVYDELLETDYLDYTYGAYTLKPTKVEGMNAVATSKTSFKVTWDALDGAESYWVYVDGVMYGNSEGCSREVTGRKPGETYQVSVIALLENGTALDLSDADVIEVKTYDLLYSEKVEYVEAVATSATTVKVSWIPIEGATKYWVYVDGAIYNSTTDSELTINKLSPYTSYCIYVTAMLADGTILKESDADIFTVKTKPTPKTGILKLDVNGGTNFKIKIGEEAERPQGTTYYNSKAPVDTLVTVTANATNGAKFLGWSNPANGQIVSTDLTYSFYTSGNDRYQAIFAAEVEGASMVMFYNDKSGQYWDMQYYAPGEDIVYPDPLPHYGFEFLYWQMTDDGIKHYIEIGEDVIVTAVWLRTAVYIDVNAVGGTVVTQPEILNGKYAAGSAVEVKANEAESGQKFAYWMDQKGNVRSYEETYKFYPTADTTMTAVFVAEDESVEYQVLVSLDNCDISGQYGTFMFSWYVPETQNGYEYQGSGVVAVNKEKYIEGNLVHGTTDINVYDREASGAASGSSAWTGPVMSGETWVAKAWVQYLDADGVLQTVYSDLFEVKKD